LVVGGVVVGAYCAASAFPLLLKTDKILIIGGGSSGVCGWTSDYMGRQCFALTAII
jgi:hypothetical protein